MTVLRISDPRLLDWFFGWLVRWKRRSLVRPPVVGDAGTRNRLFVDVTVISRHDARTGIQRVVRAVASHLLTSPPEGWDVIPVAATRKRAYSRVEWPTAQAVPIVSSEMAARAGDAFLGLDFALDTVRAHKRQLARFKRSGGQVWFMVYDLLPAERPDWFSDGMVSRFARWLRVVASLADGFYCISQPVESSLRAQLTSRYGLCAGFHTHVVPMGWDLGGSKPSVGRPAGFDELLRQLARNSTALMVGTLEPRKGHSEVIAAFNLLWEQGATCNLVIVGRPGWKTGELQGSIRSHPAFGSRLFWLDDASDEALTALYENCCGVLVASLGEGFGLPLVEALSHGKRVLARRLPVFELHRQHGVTYFPAAPTPAQLASSIEDWLRSAHQQTPDPGTLPSWKDTAQAIAITLGEERV